MRESTTFFNKQFIVKHTVKTIDGEYYRSEDFEFNYFIS